MRAGWVGPSAAGRCGWIVVAGLWALSSACGPPSATEEKAQAELPPGVAQTESRSEIADRELPVERVPHEGMAAEAYFSADGSRLIFNGKTDEDLEYHVYTFGLDDRQSRRINDVGFDACAFFFPAGDRLIWTSTRDLLDLAAGDYSDPNDYPRGAELYTSALDGSDVHRLTRNEVYDAEVSVSPDGRWILFSRQVDGMLDLWRMRADGSAEEQITHTPDWQEGGAFYLPDSETILYRAWKTADQELSPKPMTIFTLRHDGSDRRRITDDEGTNWAPYPAPDGVHFAFVKVLPPRNFEIFLGNLETGEQSRLTFDEAFDAYPAISPDGRSLVFSSSREAEPGERAIHLYSMDISSLDTGI
jgi:Tol biopolymer transport system component